MIEYIDVTKKYDKSDIFALRGINLEVKNGEIMGLVGLNGAGKTTAIKIAARVINLNSGKIKMDGREIGKDDAAIREVGLVLDTDSFDPLYTASQQLRYYCGLYGFSREEAKNIASSALGKVGLGNRMNQRLRTFSHGMRKRFMIAASVINNPSNLLLDETFNGLDPEGSRFLKEFIRDLRKQGKAILLSSHALADLADISDRIAVIHEGRILEILKRSDFGSARTDAIRMKVAPLDNSIIDILGEFGNVAIKDDEILLTDAGTDDENMNRILEKLSRSGYHVSGFDKIGRSFEDIFFDIIGKNG
ncbi:MAG: ABC transporter ATP-binding protein [Cuniculiplasma sp.]